LRQRADLLHVYDGNDFTLASCMWQASADNRFAPAKACLENAKLSELLLHYRNTAIVTSCLVEKVFKAVLEFSNIVR
jgi:hypothetical protein